MKKLTTILLSCILALTPAIATLGADANSTDAELEKEFQDAMQTTENDNLTEGEFDAVYKVSKYGSLYFNTATGTIVKADNTLRGELTIPDTINGVTVKRIGRNAFNGCIKISKFNIPDTVTEIAPYAFYLCRNITSIELPKNLTEISDYTFYNCIGLRSITINENIKSIGNGAFLACASLIGITIPASVEKIGNGAFTGCVSMLKFTVDSKNENYTSINGVIYTKDMTHICYFPSSMNIIDYTVADGVIYVDAGCFARALFLKNIYLPASTRVLYPLAFYELTDTSIYLPKYLKYMHTRSLSNSTNVTFYCVKGSYAEEFLTGKSWNYVSLDDTTTTTTTTESTTTTTTESTTKSTTTTTESTTESTTTTTESTTESTTIDDTTESTTIDSTTESTTQPELEKGDSYMLDEDTVLHKTEEGNIYINPSNGYLTNIDNSIRNLTVPETVEYERVQLIQIHDLVESESAIEESEDVYIETLTITGIEKTAFENCPDIEKISLPDTIEYIHENAFDYAPNVTITSKKNSYVYNFVKEYNLDFEAILAYLYGDVSGNGIVDASDSAAVLQKVLNSSYKFVIDNHIDDSLTYADVDYDGKITAADAAAILQKVLQNNFVLPSELS